MTERDVLLNGSHAVAREGELFAEEGHDSALPWWRANFLLRFGETVKFGTWDGVFTTCLLNTVGMVVFLRTGWVVGNAGLLLGLLVILIPVSVALFSVLSVIGVLERCGADACGVYPLLGRVLGGRRAAAIGLMYCLGQTIGASLNAVGLGESATSLLPLAPSSSSAAWTARGFAAAVTTGLIGVNAAGVKWVVRLQLALLAVLIAAILDFLIGSFANWRHPVGFAGYSAGVLSNNTLPALPSSYSPDSVNGFFTVLGVYFPTITGVMSGVNMCSDLRDPKRSVPLGSLCAVGVSCLLYLTFALVLGATCYRDALLTDYAIAQKVALLGPLFLSGLYVSALSAALGGLTGACRILASIAADTKLAFMQPLAIRKFSAQVPVYSLLTVASISLLFILIGNVNLLAPIVSMPFLLTYAAVNYSYFALAMSFDLEQRRAERFDAATTKAESANNSNGKLASNRGRALSRSSDLDKLFPAERRRSGSAVKSSATGQQQLQMPPSPSAILDKSTARYASLSNRWISLATALACLIVMFATRWEYALAAVLLLTALHLYLGRAYPGAAPGITAQFSLTDWLVDLARRLRQCCCCCRGLRRRRSDDKNDGDNQVSNGDANEQDDEEARQLVLKPPAAPDLPSLAKPSALATQDADVDYGDRERYHRSGALSDRHLPAVGLD